LADSSCSNPIYLSTYLSMFVDTFSLLQTAEEAGPGDLPPSVA